jgi:hypothetical protein
MQSGQANSSSFKRYSLESHIVEQYRLVARIGIKLREYACYFATIAAFSIEFMQM